jgi:hypothetical protein
MVAHRLRKRAEQLSQKLLRVCGYVPGAFGSPCQRLTVFLRFRQPVELSTFCRNYIAAVNADLAVIPNVLLLRSIERFSPAHGS